MGSEMCIRDRAEFDPAVARSIRCRPDLCCTLPRTAGAARSTRDGYIDTIPAAVGDSCFALLRVAIFTLVQTSFACTVAPEQESNTGIQLTASPSTEVIDPARLVRGHPVVMTWDPVDALDKVTLVPPTSTSVTSLHQQVRS